MSVQNPETVEFTLEDAYENLKDIQEDMRQELEDLIHRDSNNEFGTLQQGIRLDEIKARQHKLFNGLLKNLSSQELKDLPLPDTIDLHKTLIQDFTEVIEQMTQVTNSVRNDMAKTKKNIAYLESNIEGLEKMKSALLGAIENVGSKTTYDKEILVTGELFRQAKADLRTVVDIIFPDNDQFHELIGALTRAYMAGGDDVYIDIKPDELNFAKFLVEADIAMYHRNDKSKIKMMDLL